jgi:hypothetical protein
VSKRTVIGVALLLALTIAYVASSTYAIVQAFRYDEKIAAERQRNSVAACLDRGRTNDGIVRYLRELGAEPDEIQQARVFFPARDLAYCQRTAAATVSKP